MRIRSGVAVLLLYFVLVAAGPGVGVSLAGSPESMARQHLVANHEGLAFARTSVDVARMVESGQLVPVTGNDDYQVKAGGLAFAHPAVRAFVEHTAHLYRQFCPDTLVVTSLVRPVAAQPSNAHPLSVHPAGMAVDLRLPADPGCRDLLREYLLALEYENVLDATEERSPPHLHVAIYPTAFMAYLSWFAPDSPALVSAEPSDPDRDPGPRSPRPLMMVLAALLVGLGGFAIYHGWRSDRPRRGYGDED